METPITFSIITLHLFLYALLLLLIKKLKTERNARAINLPPGPWKLPIIGSLHHLVGGHPHRRLRSLAKTHGPLLHLKLGEITLIVISSPEIAREVLKNHDVKFASRPELMAGKIIFYDNADIGLAPYGKSWALLRKICAAELFNAKRVKSFGFIREEEGRNLVEKIRMAPKGSPVNLTEMFNSLANTTVARAAFGKNSIHQQKFLLAMKDILKWVSGFNVVDLFPSLSFLGEISGVRSRMARAHMNLDPILNEIIEEHQSKRWKSTTSADGAHANEDVVDVLLRLKEDGDLDIPLTKENIKALILDLFIAGTESMSSTMEWAMSELIRHPKLMKKTQLEMRKDFNEKSHYINQIIKEILRLHPTGPLLVPRVCRETVELAGYTIPAGSRVVINAWAIMREPRLWEDPESFRPERFEGNELDVKAANFEYIPFGAGRRMCPGMTFAYAGMEHWLAQLLFHFNWEMPESKNSESLEMEEDFGLTLTRKNKLLLIARAYE